MSETTRPRRRIDRVTAPDFLDGLDQRTSTELRQMRDDCRAEESRLSYNRRVIQAQLDIARMEQMRRRGELSGENLLSELPAILADQPTARREARTAPMYVPPDDQRRTEDAPSGGKALANLPDLDDDTLVRLIERLRDTEHEVSTERGVVLAHLDRLQAELVRRYREGTIAVDEVVGEASSGTQDS